MGYYEINIVSENCTDCGFTTSTTNKYYLETLREDNIAHIWRFISNNRLMAAKQKISFRNCIILGRGNQGWASYGGNGDTAGNSFKKFCLMFKSEVKLIQMAFTTARGREISVSIAYRKEYY